jgi:hypothetical protein
MNPLNLLTKGQTIKGFKDRSGTYRLTNKGAVPNFSVSRPTPPTIPHPERTVSQPTFFDKPQPAVPAPKLQPAPAPAPMAKAKPPESVWTRLSGICREFLSQWTARGKASPFHVRTVQAELALEKVTVIRNDLSDEDLEVMPIATKKATVTPAISRGVESVPVGKAIKPAEHEQCQVLSTNR